MRDNGYMSDPRFTPPDPRQQPGSGPGYPGARPNAWGAPGGPYGTPPAGPPAYGSPGSQPPRSSLYGELPPSTNLPAQSYYHMPMPRAPRKEPGISLLVSFFIPGVGSMINGNIGKGVGILVGYVVGFLLSFILIGLPVMLGMWVWGLVDAYRGAEEANRLNGHYN